MPPTGEFLRYAVFGAGAIGGSVAADLAEAGQAVTVVDGWRDHVAAIRQRGLVVEHDDRRVQVAVPAYHFSESPRLQESLDIVYLAVKAHETQWAMEHLVPHLHDGSLVVGLQNGMTADRVAAAAGPQRSVPVVIELSANVVEPAVIRRNTTRRTTWFGIGGATGSALWADAVDGLRRCGRVEVLADVVAAKWTKLVVNAMLLAPAALLNVTVGAVARTAALQPLMMEIGREALAVGAASGLHPQPLFGLRPADLSGSGDDMLRRLLDTVLGHIGPDGVGTTLSDLRSGRRSEVDEINGEVVTRAERCGVAAPFNAAIVAVMHEIEGGNLSPAPDNLDIVLRKAVDAGARSDIATS